MLKGANKWLLYGGLALLAILLVSRLSGSKAGTAASKTTKLQDLFGPISSAFSTVRGWLSPSTPPGQIVDIPTGGNTLPGSPVFGPIYEPPADDGGDFFAGS